MQNFIEKGEIEKSDHFGTSDPQKAVKQLKRIILSLSVEQNDFVIASKEWTLVHTEFADDNDDEIHCECGAMIKEQFFIANTFNKNTALVGSTCINRFENNEIKELANTARKNQKRKHEGKDPLVFCVGCKRSVVGGWDWHKKCQNDLLKSLNYNFTTEEEDDDLQILKYRYPWTENDYELFKTIENNQTRRIEEERERQRREKLMLRAQQKLLASTRTAASHFLQTHANDGLLRGGGEAMFVRNMSTTNKISEKQFSWFKKIIFRSNNCRFCNAHYAELNA